MSEIPSIHKIEERCRGILTSPYVVKKLPDELTNLRVLLRTVEQLAREDVPSLIAEVKRLRALNKRLEAAIEPADGSEMLDAPNVDADANTDADADVSVEVTEEAAEDVAASNR
jgi:hypothetical protein